MGKWNNSQSESTVFSMLYGGSGYFCMAIDEDDRGKRASTVRSRLNKFLFAICVGELTQGISTHNECYTGIVKTTVCLYIPEGKFQLLHVSWAAYRCKQSVNTTQNCGPPLRTENASILLENFRLPDTIDSTETLASNFALLECYSQTATFQYL